jgi:two-component system, NarL family, response regulator LiaR
MKRHVLIFGLVGGLLIATLQYTEYRFVVIEHSLELYGALVAILFAAFGIWLGLRITPQPRTGPSLPMRPASRAWASRLASSKF